MQIKSLISLHRTLPDPFFHVLTWEQHNSPYFSRITVVRIKLDIKYSIC